MIAFVSVCKKLNQLELGIGSLIIFKSFTVKAKKLPQLFGSNCLKDSIRASLHTAPVNWGFVQTARLMPFADFIGGAHSSKDHCYSHLL